MKRLIIVALLFICGLQVNAQSVVTDTLKFAAHKNEVSKFLSLLKASGVNTSEQSPLTILAPDNQAFEKLAPGILDSLLKPVNKTALTTFINSHLVNGKINAKNISAQIHSDNGQAILTTIAGTKLIAKINANRNIVLVDESSNESIIKVFDITYGNDELFIINSAIPPKKP